MENFNFSKDAMTEEEYNQSLFLILQSATEANDESIIRQATNELVEFNSKMLHKLCHEIVAIGCDYEDLYNNAVVAFISILRREAEDPEAKFKGAFFTSTKNDVRAMTYSQTAEVTKSYTTKKRHIKEAMDAATNEDGSVNPDAFDKELAKNTLKRCSNDTIDVNACDIADSAEDVIVNNERLSDIQSLLNYAFKMANLKEIDRNIISMRINDEMTLEDIAAKLGYSHMGIKKRFDKSMTKLKNIILAYDKYAQTYVA